METETSVTPSNANLAWYVVQAASQSENSVKKALLSKIKEHHLEHKFGEILVPEEEVVEIKDGIKKTSMRRIYTGYVFVEMEMSEDTWYLIKSIPKVSGFIGGSKDRPAPVSLKEVEKIRNKASVKAPVAKVIFQEGDPVRIQEGPFMGFNGHVESVNAKDQRLKVGVLIFGRSTPVELAYNQVEKVSETTK